MLHDPYDDLKPRVLQAAYKLIAAGYVQCPEDRIEDIVEHQLEYITVGYNTDTNVFEIKECTPLGPLFLVFQDKEKSDYCSKVLFDAVNAHINFLSTIYYKVIDNIVRASYSMQKLDVIPKTLIIPERFHSILHRTTLLGLDVVYKNVLKESEDTSGILLSDRLFGKFLVFDLFA